MTRDRAARQVLAGLVFAVGVPVFAVEGHVGVAVAWAVVALMWFGVALRSVAAARRAPAEEVPDDDGQRQVTAVEVPAVTGALTAGVVLAVVGDHPVPYLVGGVAVAVLAMVVARVVRWRLVSRRTG